MKKYFYKLLYRYISLYVRMDNTACEIVLEGGGKYTYKYMAEMQASHDAGRRVRQCAGPESIDAPCPDYILLCGNIHYERDIQSFFEKIYSACDRSTRVIVVYYSSLWKPIMYFASLVGLRDKDREQNWITHADVENFFRLSGFELIRRDCRVLIPFYVPLLSNCINRYIAPLPFFRVFTLLSVAIARPVKQDKRKKLSVSIVIPARNEAGNIEAIIHRIPRMGPRDEIIFIEGNSSDDTWGTIASMAERYKGKKTMVIARQDGIGKGDAVRKGFSSARNEILMILDADMTVPPEDLPKFYRALCSDAGEFINGSRLVYAIEKNAMRFFNILGNKFFASAFSFVLGQHIKDTLCGTKVISREHYIQIEKHRSYFGNFDPFGDFDLIFGAARLGLKIIEVPIAYKARTYGDTNIQRWMHGMLLMRMLVFAARKMKFI